MAHMIETMAYAGETPWHGLGVKVNPTLNPDQMLEAAGLNWEVYKEELQTKSGILIPNRFALIRSSDRKPLSVCSNKYIPIQNSDAFSFFNRFIDAGRMKMETAGSLDDGKMIWALARMEKGDFELANNDVVQSYVLLAQPHVAGKSMLISSTGIRVVCMNTLRMALNQVGERASGVFRMTHHKEFDGEMQQLAQDVVGLSSQKMLDYKNTAQFLSSKKATDGQINKYLVQLITGEDSIKKVADFTPVLHSIKDLVGTQAGHELAEGTWWNTFNAVTYWTDHITGRSPDARLRQAWFGKWAGKKTEALKLAVEYAKLSKAA